jgi:type II secretory pathway component PulK
MNTRSRSNRHRRRGTVLIVAIFIVFTMAGLVIMLTRSMRVESLASANLAASVQAASIERGAEQYVLAILTEQKDTLDDLDETYYAAIQVGDGYFWVLRPDYGDNTQPLFGLTDEAAKVNINTASYDSLMKLPNMTDEVAAAIIDWRDADDNVYQGGAEREYYSSYGQYLAKNAPFETVEELMMVKGMSRDLLYGNGTALPLGTQQNYRQQNSREMTDLQSANGLYDYLTVYSAEPGGASGATGSASSGSGGTSSGGASSGGTSGGASGGGGGAAGGKVNINDRNQRTALRDLLISALGQPRADQIIGQMGRGSQYIDVFDFYFQVKLKPDELDTIYSAITTGTTANTKGRINVNTAPRDVLLTLPNLESADVDKLVSARSSVSSSTSGSIAWVADALEKKAVGLADRITGKSYQYSADILAVSGNGRAFKRVRLVINVSGTTPQVVYRRDLTDRGWPMDTDLLASLRAGQGLGQSGTAASAGSGRGSSSSSSTSGGSGK